MRVVWMFGLCVLAAGCLRLSVDESRDWACETDADCPGDRLCKSTDGEFLAAGRCQLPEWCDSNDDCVGLEVCADDNRCTPVGGADGVCETDDDCVNGYVCGDSGRCACDERPEICDGLDNDCDGETDEDFDLGESCTGEGECGEGVWECSQGARICSSEPGGSDRAAETEVCDGLDNDCDGEVDEGFGTETCGVGACERTVDLCTNGEEVSCEPLPPQDDVCDGLDNDCDGEVDNDPAFRLEIEGDVGYMRCDAIAWQLGDAVASCANSEAAGETDWAIAGVHSWEKVLAPCDPPGTFDTQCTPCAEAELCSQLFPGDTNVYYAGRASDTSTPALASAPLVFADLATGELRRGNTNTRDERCVLHLDAL